MVLRTDIRARLEAGRPRKRHYSHPGKRRWWLGLGGGGRGGKQWLYSRIL